MASGASSSSTKAAEVAPRRYEVFLSFRGPDTRYGFVSHLFNALYRQKIKTYVDDKSLERGNEIAYSLSRAIQESVVSIVVFSEKYASSRWCLDELVHILKCKQSHGQIVVPVFYHVEPTHVRNKEGRFGEGFSTLIKEKRFADKVDKWRTALTTASDLSGYTLSAQSPEADKVDEIVEDVKRKLYGMSQTSNDFKGLVGIEKRVEKIKSLLRLSTRDDVVRPIGVWGMGGIGKTTLATVVFENVKNQFQGCCFLKNVREQWEKGQSEDLKKKLHSDLLGEENPYNVTKRLKEKRVFIVLDDIDNQHQLEFLVGDCSGFRNGSRIIVTTRNREMLRYLEAYDDVYEVEELNNDEALQLFLLNAFKAQSSVEGQYIEILKKVMNNAKGFPLALKVLGSVLRCKKKEDWESYLNELIEEPPNEIQNVLRVSYDHGLDEKDQSIFLDIVCFFKGRNRDSVEEILDACYVSPNFSAKRRIKNLIEKSLLTIGEFNRLWMHDLLQEMGWKIVSSPKEPGKRSRLWIAEEIYSVLKNNSGTETIEGIDLYQNHTEEVDIGPLTFEGMHSLRFLKITQMLGTIGFPQGLQSLPNALRYLDWDGCELESFPSKFSPQNLVELHMTSCLKLKQLWSGVQNLKNLRHINLRRSWSVIRIPDLSHAPKLESINLEDCLSLVEVPPLNFQVFENHTSQKKFRKDLGTLDLLKCCSLKYFPNISGNVKRLDLTYCYGIDSIPPSIKDLSTLIELQVSYCMNLKALPQLPLSLGLLDARGCELLETVATSRSEIIQAHCKDYHATHYKQFLFGECQCLDQNSRNSIMTESYVRLLRTAILSVSKPEEISSLFEDHKPIVQICLPRNEITNWFRHQSNESWITIKLRPNWQANFIGFALCAVALYQRKCMIKCEYSFKTNDEDFCPSPKFESNYEPLWTPEWTRFPTDHLFIWYSHEDYHDYHDAFEISFRFSLFNHMGLNVYRRSILVAKRCGVRLLYFKDVEKLGIKYYKDPNMQEISDDDISDDISDDDIPELAISDRNGITDSILDFPMSYRKGRKFLSKHYYMLTPSRKERSLGLSSE